MVPQAQKSQSIQKVQDQGDGSLIIEGDHMTSNMFDTMFCRVLLNR